MRHLTATTRVTFGLVCLSLSVWLLASTFGILPNKHAALVQHRIKLSETLAIQSSLLASDNDHQRIQIGLEAFLRRNPDVVSAAIRRKDGSLYAEAGNHATHWVCDGDERNAETHMLVPVMSKKQDWGHVEVRYRDSVQRGFLGWIQRPLIRLVMFVGAASYLLYFFYLRKMLEHLDPSQVIPEHVRTTLDTFAEGLIVVDRNERILLANRAFSATVGSESKELVGRNASQFPWQHSEESAENEFPWVRSMRDGTQQLGQMLTLKDDKSTDRIFKINSSPILTGEGKARGAFVSFDDVTILEKNRTEMKDMLARLSRSRDDIRRQNQELERLATVDPLTSCLNRRAFFRELEAHWDAAQRHNRQLSVLMVDIDHFKSINDNHGHSTGDNVLRKIGEILSSNRRDGDLVCRYGGEEFCVLLPNATLDDAAAIAETIREAIESTEIESLSITASLGLSARFMGAKDTQELIDEADQCLYIAKRAGRNQVVRWDLADEYPEYEESEKAPAGDAKEIASEIDSELYEETIPFHAVTALVSALGYRDPTTADHSRRVADLCVAMADGLMSARELFVLETAAMLHDIGKIGVPDSILLKPDKLTDEEWQVMNRNERVGQEIIQTTFSNQRLAEIVTTYRAWYGGNPRHPELPTGLRIPLGARILALADAYDSMVTDRVYRKGRTRDQAFHELRRCAMKQFDPDLVERLVDVVLPSERHDEQRVDPAKAAILNMGNQIERLADALQQRDVDGIAVLASRLNMTANQHGIDNVAELADQLESAAIGETDMVELVRLTSELVDVCRSAQLAFLGHESSDERESASQTSVLQTADA